MSFEFDGLSLDEKSQRTIEWVERIDGRKYQKTRNFFVPFYSLHPRSLRLFTRGVFVAPQVEDL